MVLESSGKSGLRDQADSLGQDQADARDVHMLGLGSAKDQPG